MTKNTKREGETEKDPQYEDNVFGLAAKSHWVVLGIVCVIALVVWLVRLLT